MDLHKLSRCWCSNENKEGKIMNTHLKQFQKFLTIFPFIIISSCFSKITSQIKIEAGNLRIQLNKDNGTVENIFYGDKKLPVKEGEALIKIRDVKYDTIFYPLLGKIIKKGDGYELQGIVKQLDIKSKVQFKSRNGNLLLYMDFVNGRRDERGLVILTMLNFTGNDYVWGGGLYEEDKTLEHKFYGNNRYPITTLHDNKNNWGLALAVPPDCPVFYSTHYKDGAFGIEYYLALTPATKSFPNEAKLNALVYAINPKWGFRSGLKNYYSAFPDYYKRRIKEAGLWYNGSMYPFPEDVKFYEATGFHQINTNNYGPFLKEVNSWKKTNQLARVKGVDIFPYTIPGQRQIYDLTDTTLNYISNHEFFETNKIITSKEQYNLAMNLFKNWDTDNIIRFQTAGNANGFRSVKELKEIINNCGIYNSAGDFTVISRTFHSKCITFPLNPNPELFENSDKMTIAKYILDFYIPEFLKAMPDIAGIYFDSMGRWGAYLNYRREHFKYAQYPLSIDLKGNAVIPNVISHYEFLNAARKYLHRRNKLVFSNGVAFTDVKSPDGVNDYDATKGTSRFFIAALCDLATCESGAETSMKNMILYRTYMGKKPYAVVAYQHEPVTEMEKYFKRGLVMDIFTSMAYGHFDSMDVNNAKILHEKYLPLMKMLYKAGWEPINGVSLAGEINGVYCERYGDPLNGKTFFVIYNDSSNIKDISLNLDSGIFHKSPSRAVNLCGSKESFNIINRKIDLRLDPWELKLLQIRH